MQSSNPFLIFIHALLGLLSVSSESPALYAQCQLSTTRLRAAADLEGISATMTFTDYFRDAVRFYATSLRPQASWDDIFLLIVLC
ncbi:hypothetical protein MRX96_005982 [Rhipicephalus microplus]